MDHRACLSTVRVDSSVIDVRMQWPSLEKHTVAPYTLSLKSNGCIIFIAALTPEKLLVTSKHSLGPAASDKKVSHADAGERWLRKYFVQKGRTEADLAGVLWKNNWTAIAEVRCVDCCIHPAHH